MFNTGAPISLYTDQIGLGGQIRDIRWPCTCLQWSDHDHYSNFSHKQNCTPSYKNLLR